MSKVKVKRKPKVLGIALILLLIVGVIGAMFSVTEVFAASGTLVVTTSPVAGDIYVDSSIKGKGSINLEIESGKHKVSYGDVQGYYTPNAKEVDVPAGGKVTVRGVYSQGQTTDPTQPPTGTTYTLTIEPSGKGIVIPNGTIVFDEPTEVTAKAVASSGWHFVSWNYDSKDIGKENPIKVTVDKENQILMATFVEDWVPPTVYFLKINTIPSNIAFNYPNAITPAKNTYAYNSNTGEWSIVLGSKLTWSGESVSIKAINVSNWYFVHFEVDGVVKLSNPITITMKQDHTVFALYEEYIPEVSTTVTVEKQGLNPVWPNKDSTILTISVTDEYGKIIPNCPVHWTLTNFRNATHVFAYLESAGMLWPVKSPLDGSVSYGSTITDWSGVSKIKLVAEVFDGYVKARTVFVIASPQPVGYHTSANAMPTFSIYINSQIPTAPPVVTTATWTVTTTTAGTTTTTTQTTVSTITPPKPAPVLPITLSPSAVTMYTGVWIPPFTSETQISGAYTVPVKILYDDKWTGWNIEKVELHTQNEIISITTAPWLYISSDVSWETATVMITASKAGEPVVTSSADFVLHKVPVAPPNNLRIFVRVYDEGGDPNPFSSVKISISGVLVADEKTKAGVLIKDVPTNSKDFKITAYITTDPNTNRTLTYVGGLPVGVDLNMGILLPRPMGLSIIGAVSNPISLTIIALAVAVFVIYTKPAVLMKRKKLMKIKW